MTAPQLPVQFPLPTDGGRPMTYPELLRQLSCVCTAGAQIKPITIPSATVNLGDVIADHTQLLTALTSAYAIIVVIMKIIVCIIDVLCAIPNPFAVTAAMIRLFGTCLPEFILILPQLAIPAHILCLIKVVVAIIRFILEVIVPLIQDIIQNVTDLVDAIADQDQDSINATVFKITQLLKEVINIVGILAALDALIIMIKALLEKGVGLPCGGAGGSCTGCGDNQCPEAIQGYSIDGNDGNLTVLFNNDGFSFDIMFTSASMKDRFLQLRDFFPSIDYSRIDDLDKVAYTLEIGSSTYVVTSVDGAGCLDLIRIQNPTADDGYLSSVYNVGGIETPFLDPTNQVRFGTKTEIFSASNVNDYIDSRDLDPSGAILNSGVFKIGSFYDAYNVRLDKTDGSGWTADAVFDPSSGSGGGDKIAWRIVPKAPSSIINQTFSLKINHNELIRHDMISLGCHPEISAQAQGLANRFPLAANLTLPDLPTGLVVNTDTGRLQALDNALACLSGMIPNNVEELDSYYVLDNYNTIAQDAASAEACLSASLGDVPGGLENILRNYAGELYPRLFSAELSNLTVDRYIQFVGGDVEVTLTVTDIYGNPLADDVPIGIVDAGIFSTFGVLGNIREDLDSDGVPTSEYKATLSSSTAGIAEVTGSVAGIFVSDFVDDFEDTGRAPHLVPRTLMVEFIDPPEDRHKRPDGIGTGSSEPLGIASPGRGR